MLDAAETLVAEIDRLVPCVKPHASNSANHLQRSAESVLFNASEGVGANKPKVKIASYETAKKEAHEVRTILRRLVIKNVLAQHEIQRASNLAAVLIRMLTNAMITLGNR